MTREQLHALAKLMRSKTDSKAFQAAEDVLINGLTQAQAVKKFGVSASTVGDAVTRYTNANDLIKKAYFLT